MPKQVTIDGKTFVIPDDVEIRPAFLDEDGKAHDTPTQAEYASLEIEARDLINGNIIWRYEQLDTDGLLEDAPRLAEIYTRMQEIKNDI